MDEVRGPVYSFDPLTCLSPFSIELIFYPSRSVNIGLVDVYTTIN